MRNHLTVGCLLLTFVGYSPTAHGQTALKVSGEIETTAGIRFPDGTLQTTAASSAATSPSSLTANSGLYSNVIADFVPPLAYTEVCFKDGLVLSDVHTISEGPAGGACEPGDTGWIIERLERASGATMSWTNARAECLRDGMRLPEYFEWQYTCNSAGLFGVSDMTDNWEWASNEARFFHPEITSGIGAALMGSGGCGRGSWAWVGVNSGGASGSRFRCVR